MINTHTNRAAEQREDFSVADAKDWSPLAHQEQLSGRETPDYSWILVLGAFAPQRYRNAGNDFTLRMFMAQQ